MAWSCAVEVNQSSRRKPHRSGMGTANQTHMLLVTGIEPGSPRWQAHVPTSALTGKPFLIFPWHSCSYIYNDIQVNISAGIHALTPSRPIVAFVRTPLTNDILLFKRLWTLLLLKHMVLYLWTEPQFKRIEHFVESNNNLLFSCTLQGLKCMQIRMIKWDVIKQPFRCINFVLLFLLLVWVTMLLSI